MFILANVIEATARVLQLLLQFYFYVVIIAALVSWVRPDPYSPVVRFLRNATEPVQYRIRRWLPFTFINGLDLSPIVILLCITFLQSAVVQSLFELAVQLKLGMPSSMP